MNDNFKGLSDSELRNIIDNLHDEIMIYDNNYRLVYVNNACIRHYGFGTEKFLGKKFNQLDEIYWGNSTLPDVYKEKKIVAKHQITNLGNDIITISVPIFDKKGKIKYVCQNVNDIYIKSEIGKAEEFFLDVSKKENENDVPYIYKSGKEILVKDMPKSIFDIYSKPQNFCKGKTLNEVLESVERQVVIKAYKKCKSSVAVAKELGISQPKAYRLIKKYGLK
ncbi:MAG: PAS domain S-box protein [Clostridia bacterium]|jgi:PAS domain S-box-containing protein|nr:PAS domain S-box protein [Clostridia bacterium]MCI2000231.1 PAS domain S-box protein [Clostridia bacterium]MCI2014604.1 PAS domain S-box protein [Clostridia bacterium]